MPTMLELVCSRWQRICSCAAPLGGGPSPFHPDETFKLFCLFLQLMKKMLGVQTNINNR